MNDERTPTSGDEGRRTRSRGVAARGRAARAATGRMADEVRAAVEAEWRAVVAARQPRRRFTPWLAAASVAALAVGAWLVAPQSAAGLGKHCQRGADDGWRRISARAGRRVAAAAGRLDAAARCRDSYGGRRPRRAAVRRRPRPQAGCATTPGAGRSRDGATRSGSGLRRRRCGRRGPRAFRDRHADSARCGTWGRNTWPGSIAAVASSSPCAKAVSRSKADASP